MRERSWGWLRSKITGLLTSPPRGYLRVDSEDGRSYRMRPIWANRLSEVFYAEAK